MPARAQKRCASSAARARASRRSGCARSGKGRSASSEALARALALAARFGQPWLDRWFSQRETRNEALAVHYGA